MAARIRVTSVILASLPRGGRLVSLGGGRRLARVGLIARWAQGTLRNLLRSDTPPSALALSPIAARSGSVLLHFALMGTDVTLGPSTRTIWEGSVSLERLTYDCIA